jgi:hypothetical protein
MLTIHISESETPTQTATNTGSTDGLAACLAQYGVSPGVIQATLHALPRLKRLILCKPTDADAWQIAEPSIPLGPPA